MRSSFFTILYKIGSFLKYNRKGNMILIKYVLTGNLIADLINNIYALYVKSIMIDLLQYDIVHYFNTVYKGNFTRFRLFRLDLSTFHAIHYYCSEHDSYVEDGLFRQLITSTSYEYTCSACFTKKYGYIEDFKIIATYEQLHSLITK
jgi:hypothetical protein